MKSDSLAVEIYLPNLSDAAAVEVREFLHNLSLLFSSHYHAQIQRDYEEHELTDARRVTLCLVRG